MYKNIRLISFFLLIALFVAPLGSCASKKTKDGNSIRTTWHALDELSEDELKEAEIRSFKIYDTKIRGIDIKGSGGILYLILLVGTFLLTNVKKNKIWSKLLNVVLLINFFLMYFACSYFAYAAHTTTIYGWIFMLIGFVYIWLCIPKLVPKIVKSA